MEMQIAKTTRLVMDKCLAVELESLNFADKHLFWNQIGDDFKRIY